MKESACICMCLHMYLYYCCYWDHHDYTNNPTLNLDGSEIPLVDQYKFLGVIFDKKLSFISHIQYLKEKCSKTLKLFRVITHKDWGAYQHTLLKLYRILIRFKNWLLLFHIWSSQKILPQIITDSPPWGIKTCLRDL